MSTPFTLAGTLSYPPDTGQPEAPIPFSGAGNFTAKIDQEVPFTGAGSFTLTIPAGKQAKVLLVEVDSNTNTASIEMVINGGTDVIELKPGSSLAYFNPNPTVAGISSVGFTHTADGKVRVRALA